MKRPSAPAAGRSVPRWVLAVFVVLVGGLTAVFAASPVTTTGSAAYAGVGIAASVAISYGVHRNRPSPRLAWTLIGLAPLFGTSGMLLRIAAVELNQTGVSLVADYVTIPGYLLFGAGLLCMLRARRAADHGSAIDSGLMAAAAFGISWTTLISPIVADPLMPSTVKVINSIYPTISVSLLFVGALIAMTEVVRITSFWILATGWIALATGDVVYALAALGKAPLPLWVANCAYCAFYCCIGASALHPSMTQLTRPTPRRVRGYGHSRFVGVTVALLVPAAVMAIDSPDRPLDRVVTASFVALIGVLVLVRTATAVNRHASSESRLQHQAHHDSLTGLPNRLYLLSYLEGLLGRAAETGGGVGVLFMDLDQFKIVNDNWGHETGDELLRVVASRLLAYLQHGELVARVGGDEFIVVSAGLDDVGQAVEVARRMLGAFADPIPLRSAEVTISPSMGVAFAEAGAPVTVSDLLRESDTAMYRSKALGPRSIMVFDESMRTEIGHRVALERDLRGALSRGELLLHYQPIVDLPEGTINGFEALMRWQHPERGMVPPDEFIGVAEDLGLIVELGKWAIEQAVGQIARWRTRTGRPLTMSVNLSPRQLRDPRLVSFVTAALAAHDLPGDALCLELTESALMEDLVTARDRMRQLKRLGVRLAADDFGTGHSSLAYLRQLPFDQVKVDRTFVAGLDLDPEDAVIVGAVLSMANALSLSTVAEGVETETQRMRLVGLGAREAQGWLFSRPLPPEQIDALLDRIGARGTPHLEHDPASLAEATCLDVPAVAEVATPLEETVR